MVNRCHDRDDDAGSIDGPGCGTARVRAPSVDLAALDRATGGDRALQREVVQMFAEQVTDKLEVIRRSVTERDAETLRQASHTLLGSCTTLGVVGMAEQLATLERLAASTSFETAEAVCEALAVETVRSLRFLEQCVLSSR